MSVINKMLRDLDLRQRTSAPAAAASGRSAEQAALREGTSSVAFGDSAANQSLTRRSHLWMGLGLLLVVLALAGGAWFWQYTHGTSPRVEIGVPAPPAPIATAPVPVAAMPASATASDPIASVAAAPTVSVPEVVGAAAGNAAVATTPTAVVAENAPAAAMALRMETSLSARKALDALLSTPTPVTVRTPNAVAPSAAPIPAPVPPANSGPGTPTAAERPRARPTVAPSTAPATPATAGESAPAIQRQQQAGGDAMAQAQALWNSGSHDAAIDLMQQSIAAAERSAKAGTSAGSGVVLVTLVREMTRMQLAEARYGAVWEMLTRLEPWLGNPPDLWAIRANAAQRLGRHQDSVHAYMMALQSRPDEQRWLLGTAVSLAALGQTSSAAEMANKARAVGPISRDILAYLRQAGVPLRD